jgi:protease-4
MEAVLMRSYISAITLLMLMVLSGCSAPSLLITPVSSSSDLEEVQVADGNGIFGPKIAIIEVEGMLANVRSGGLLTPSENKLSLFTQELEAAAKDDKVKAVVLRINSPGGTVTCSETMYSMVKKFREKTHKPVISSTQEVCASGAYYVACSSDVIVASPTSVVGSIGVIFETVDLSGTMMKLGIRSEPVKSAPLKDMGSPFKPLDPDARAIMQGMVDEYYAKFINVVTTNRKQLTDPAKIKTATDGRVFSGEQALAMGLVDRLGHLDDAIDLARQMSNSSGAKVIMYTRPYGYSGSIYAEMPLPPPQANVTTLQLPDAELLLPRGFYYLWQD